METLRHYTSVTLLCARLSLQRQLEYPLFLINWLLMIPLQYLSGILLLKVLVGRFQPLEGWGFPEIAFLYGLALISHGMQVFLFIPIWGIENFITGGFFDRMLVRPMNVFFQVLVRYVNLIGCVDMLPGVIIFGYGCWKTGFVWSAANILKLLLVLAGATLLRAGVYTIAGSTAFWTMRSRPLIDVAQETMHRTGFYPLTIYPAFLQWLFTLILPIGFISFYPAAEFLGKEEGMLIPAAMAFATPLVGLAFFAVAIGVFNWGLRQYESSGS